MLNEIFKGMDNAAEMIDSNFKKVGYEHEKTEDGEYIKFANGFAICWREITFNRSTSNGESGLTMPIEFIETVPVFGGAATSMSSWRDRNDISQIGVSTYPDAWSFHKEGSYNWAGSGDFTVTQIGRAHV